jgi:tRNA (guanine-N7-)-methyltransferase
MGRRALRQIDPKLDLSRHYREADDLPAALDAVALFGRSDAEGRLRSAPLEVEVGSGKGLFLASASLANSDRDFLGIEVAQKYARYSAAKLARQGASNAIVIHGDALALFRQWFPPANLAAVHVYFPDPWWKKRHKKRRVLNEDFLKDVERTLAPGGRLHFWTDVEEYFQATLALTNAVTTLEGPLSVAEVPAEHDLDYRTHFERRTRQHAQPVFRAEFAKR